MIEIASVAAVFGAVIGGMILVARWIYKRPTPASHDPYANPHGWEEW